MCQRVECPRCGRPTWAGCGAHVEQALRGVPADQRCQCREQNAGAGPAAQGGVFSWLRNLSGR